MDTQTRLENLKRMISEHVANGGSIYAPKRQLPYYDYLSDTVKMIRKQTGKQVTHEDVYLMCGIKFDRDFNDFCSFLTDLKMFASDSMVDKIRTTEVRKVNNVYERLKNYADKYNTTPFDFLALMTNFEFSECYIKTDNYSECLKYLILKEYPNRDISGIKRARPELYEQLRQLQRYYPTSVSMKTLVSDLGFVWDRASTDVPSSPSEESVLKELEQNYPDKIVDKIHTHNPGLYAHIVRLCQAKKKSIKDWLSAQGYSYPGGLAAPQLSFIKVNAKSRIRLLCELKRRALEQLDLKSCDETELFHASLDASKTVIEYINSRPTLDLLIKADQLTEEAQQ